MRLFKQISMASALALMASGALGQDVTLRVWDTFADQTAGMEAFIAAFEESHPNIKIARDVQSADNMRAVIQTALNSGTGPDVLYYDTGPGYGGVLARSGLLLPLDDFYDSGALATVYPWTRDRVTFDGVTYGIGNEVEFVGVYYNRGLFEKLGLKEPETYKDYLDVVEALKADGVIPVAFGDSQGWPAFHTFSAYVNARVPQQDLLDMIAGKASWDDPRVTASIQAAFIDMNEAGAYPPSINAISYDDANALFSTEMAGMDLTGSWMIATFKNNPFDTGFFFLPSEDGTNPLPPAGLGSGYFISKNTEHPEEAKEFLKFLFDPANAHFWVEDMSVLPPYPVDASGMDIPSLLQFALSALAEVEMGFNIDVLTPDKFNTAMSDGFQAVIAGDRSAAEQAAALQQAMAQ